MNGYIPKCPNTPQHPIKRPQHPLKRRIHISKRNNTLKMSTSPPSKRTNHQLKSYQHPTAPPKRHQDHLKRTKHLSKRPHHPPKEPTPLPPKRCSHFSSYNITKARIILRLQTYACANVWQRAVLI